MPATNHLRKCAESEAAGVLQPGDVVQYDDHGEQRRATVVAVKRYADESLQGYVLDVDGFARGVHASAYEVTGP